MSNVARKLRARTRERSAHLTELGNAERFTSMHGDRFRYVQTWKQWLHYDGRRWSHDEMGAVITAAKKVVAQLYSEASDLAKRAASGDEQAGKIAEALAKWARTSSKHASITAMVSLARSEDPIAAAPSAFDCDPWLLNVENGTLDLRTSKLRPHAAGDMITKLAPVVYDSKATCPLWTAFLERVQPDPDARAWLKRLVGYALTGVTREQIMTFLLGEGANGKSVFLDVLLDVIGDYGLRAAPDLVLAKHNEAHPTEQADLDGKRLAAVSEIDQGRSWAESTIKRLTGDKTISARRMNQNFYTFVVTHKIVVAANTKPTVRGTDYAIWRRMRLVPFSVTIPVEERDPDLVTKLLAERSGILAWAVEGCLEWQKFGLGETPTMAKAAAEYRESQDILGSWIEDECVLVPDAFTLGDRLYASYVAWCSRNGHEPWTRRAWNDRLTERPGLENDRRHAGRGVAGIGLRTRAASHLGVA